MQPQQPTPESESRLALEPEAPQAQDFATLRIVLAARRDEPGWPERVAADLAAAALDTMPESAVDETLRMHFDRAALSVMHEVIDMVIAGADPAGASAPPQMVEAARELISRGESVERLIRAYHLAHARFFELWAGDVRASMSDPADIGAAIEQGATWTFAFVEAIGQDISALGDGERESWSSSAAAVRLQETRAVLAGTQTDSALASARLGYELARRHRAFLLWYEGDTGEDTGPRLQVAAAQLVARLGAPSSLMVALEEDLVAVWVAAAREPVGGQVVTEAGQLDRCVAAGTIQPGLAGFRRSHEEARAARRVAELRGDSPVRVEYRDVAVLDLATQDLRAARRFVERELGPLAGGERHTVRLAETLRAYLESLGSPRRAAARLGVHENTVTNRVHAAEELLGHGVEGRVGELLLALQLAPITRRRAQSPGDAT